MKKKKHLSPSQRRKQMKRANRLRSAKAWLATYAGKNIIRGYRKYYGVNVLCAIKELQLLETELETSQVDSALASHAAACEQRRREREKKQQQEDIEDDFWYEHWRTSAIDFELYLIIKIV